MELSGRQGLDLSMDYYVRVPLQLVTQVAWRKLFGGKKREEVDPDQIDEIDVVGDVEKIRFLNVKITGTVEKYEVTLGRDKEKRSKRRRNK
jgi:hypothetical protein